MSFKETINRSLWWLWLDYLRVMLIETKCTFKHFHWRHNNSIYSSITHPKISVRKSTKRQRNGYRKGWAEIGQQRGCRWSRNRPAVLLLVKKCELLFLQISITGQKVKKKISQMKVFGFSISLSNITILHSLLEQRTKLIELTVEWKNNRYNFMEF